MCGITGYVGYRQADKILFECLKKLEYRGYDSCGIALVTKNGLSIFKDQSRVGDLEKKYVKTKTKATVGIGHTRWATCGEPNATNAHPHSDCSKNIATVHNGTIDNYLELKKALTKKGHKFKTETDTEVFPHLVEEYMKDNDAETAFKKAFAELKGSFAIATVIGGEDKIYIGRINCPLVIGVMDGEYIIASDSTTLLRFTNRFIYLQDGDMGVISKDKVTLFRNGKTVKPKIVSVENKYDDTELHGYPHYMLKEIHEQPRIISSTIDDIEQLTLLINQINKDLGGIKMIRTLSCGSSYYSSLILRYLAPQLLGIPTFAELGSEYCSLTVAPKGSLAIAISQSGETADTIKAAKEAKAYGYKVLAITNVSDSQLSRLSDYTWITKAGPEISVAATKTVMSQAAWMYAFVLANPSLRTLQKKASISSFRKVPELMKQLLEQNDETIEVAKYLKDFEDIIYVSRGITYPIALEGALKMKEIAYIHSEGYAAGELKHGPFALLSEEIPVVALVSHDKDYSSLVTNLREIKTRKAPLIVITDEKDIMLENLAEKTIVLPKCDATFVPLLHLVEVQLLAYYTAVERNNPIDFPRNLAKTVTVE